MHCNRKGQIICMHIYKLEFLILFRIMGCTPLTAKQENSKKTVTTGIESTSPTTKKESIQVKDNENKIRITLPD